MKTMEANKNITINAMKSVGVYLVLKECESFKIQYQVKGNEES